MSLSMFYDPVDFLEKYVKAFEFEIIFYSYMHQELKDILKIFVYYLEFLQFVSKNFRLTFQPETPIK